jgi:anti-sigma-K factor RskA
MSLKDELLSAYIDGEVESPHREHIQRQIETNDDVRRRYSRLASVKEALRSEELPDFSAVQARVLRNIEDSVDRPEPVSPCTSFWRRQWRLPAPLVSAAALVFAFLLGFSVYHLIGNPSRDERIPDIAQAHSPVDLTISLADSDVERVLDWLSSRDLLGEINVELPESHRFRIIGEPELLRAADYGRSTR